MRDSHRSSLGRVKKEDSGSESLLVLIAELSVRPVSFCVGSCETNAVQTAERMSDMTTKRAARLAESIDRSIDDECSSG